MKNRKISWDKQAINYFREAISYIRKDSPKNAEKVKKETLKKISELSKRPEILNYRAFELYRFRVGYLVKEDEILLSG